MECTTLQPQHNKSPAPKRKKYIFHLICIIFRFHCNGDSYFQQVFMDIGPFNRDKLFICIASSYWIIVICIYNTLQLVLLSYIVTYQAISIEYYYTCKWENTANTDSSFYWPNIGLYWLILG